jgi:hypothetical protein
MVSEEELHPIIYVQEGFQFEEAMGIREQQQSASVDNPRRKQVHPAIEIMHLNHVIDGGISSQ